MAALFSTAIVAFCASTATGQYNDACNKAVDAGTRQIGWRNKLDTAEDRTIQFVNTTVQSHTPQRVQEVLGAAGFVYKTVRDQRLYFRLPTLGICDSLSNEVTPNSYAISIRWNVP